MAEPPTDPESHSDARDPEAITGTPRWVKVFGVIALVLVLLVVIVLMAGGNHGPGRHVSSGDAAGEAPSSSATEPVDAGGHRPPAGGHKP